MADNVVLIENLSANVLIDDGAAEKEILNRVTLSIAAGETHLLMGTNGSGKSTLSNVLMGHPYYRVTNGRVTFKGEDLLRLRTDERARKGLFVAMQYPTTVEGLAVGAFLKAALEAVRGEEIPVRVFKKELEPIMDALNIPREFLSRSLNEGFSGGEKKRMEILQMMLLKPTLSILDETDSGLDVDALKLVFNAVRAFQKRDNAFLVITHYHKVLSYLNPTHVHVMKEGTIALSGGNELSDAIEQGGFEAILPK